MDALGNLAVSAVADALPQDDEIQKSFSISLKRQICKHLETVQKVLLVILY